MAAVFTRSATKTATEILFGFNTQTGYGHCYVCGTMLAKGVCEVLNIDSDQVGGLVERPQPLVKRKPAPDKPKDTPPSIPTTYKLPDWLEQYMDWSSITGNQTPMIFHQAAGLWLLATAVGRRLYGEAPWGVKIYPNLYRCWWLERRSTAITPPISWRSGWHALLSRIC